MNLSEINQAYNDQTLALMNESTLFAAQNKVDLTIDRIRQHPDQVSDEGLELERLEEITSFITAALDTKYDPISLCDHAD